MMNCALSQEEYDTNSMKSKEGFQDFFVRVAKFLPDV